MTDGVGEYEPLNLVHAEVVQLFHQGQRMHARSGRFHAHGIGESHHSTHEVHVAEIVAQYRFEELRTDLESVERRPAQIGKRGHARAELVERQAHAQLEQLTEGSVDLGGIAEQDRLVEFEFETRRIEARFVQYLADQVDKSVGFELDRRDVEREAQATRPLHRVLAGPAQSPFADRNDQAATFRNREESIGRDAASVLVFPGIFRFETNDLVRAQLDHWLVFDGEIAILDRASEVFLHTPAQIGFVLEVCRIEAELAASAVLRGIERQVCRTGQFLALDAVIGSDRHPDGATDGATTFFDRIRLREHLDDLLGDFAQLAAVVHVGDEDLEFVATEAPDLAAAADSAAKAVRDLL